MKIRLNDRILNMDHIEEITLCAPTIIIHNEYTYEIRFKTDKAAFDAFNTIWDAITGRTPFVDISEFLPVIEVAP